MKCKRCNKSLLGTPLDELCGRCRAQLKHMDSMRVGKNEVVRHPPKIYTKEETDQDFMWVQRFFIKHIIESGPVTHYRRGENGLELVNNFTRG
jgi:hypothetical protein